MTNENPAQSGMPFSGNRPRTNKMVFFMVSILLITGKPAPLLEFRGLFTIEWE
jgi:hypothetical protein